VSDVRLEPDPTAHRGATMYPADLKYTKEHEWVKITGSDARVGITE
jgi:hypothetical protein